MTLLTEPTRIVLRKTPSTWAEGGDLVYTIVVSGITYRVHTFTTVGTSALTVLNGGDFEYLIVAGGGGGGYGRYSGAGGGGAGGLLKFIAGESGARRLLALITTRRWRHELESQPPVQRP
jgi:hypothetical protein